MFCNEDTIFFHAFYKIYERKLIMKLCSIIKIYYFLHLSTLINRVYILFYTKTLPGFVHQPPAKRKMEKLIGQGAFSVICQPIAIFAVRIKTGSFGGKLENTPMNT